MDVTVKFTEHKRAKFGLQCINLLIFNIINVKDNHYHHQNTLNFFLKSWPSLKAGKIRASEFCGVFTVGTAITIK